MRTLETNRLILRSLEDDDLEDFYAYCKKETIGPKAGWAPHQSIEESSRILAMMIKEDEVWGITIKPNNQIVGTIGLHVRNFDNAMLNQKEIGYVLDDIYWGQGYMVEAVSAVLRFAFDDLELTQVLCGHEISNIQSKKVIEKAGFIYTHEEYRDHYDHSKIKIKMYAYPKAYFKEKNKHE